MSNLTNKKGQYRTNQRMLLQKYLHDFAGQHVTVSDICTYFQNHGRSIGKTTIYRQLEKMVDEGLVDKYIVDSTSPACFVYVGEHEDNHVHSAYHCKCERCGELFHVYCNELDKIESHLLENHSFVLNPQRTVFYGVCENCRRAEPTEA